MSLHGGGPADHSDVAEQGEGDWMGRWLENEFIESYVRWREACESVRAAYERWGSSERCDRGDAFAAYRAALDQEECAARVYSDSAGRLSELAR